MLAQQWRDDLVDAIHTYARQRRRTPSVRVTLVDGDVQYVESVEAGPGDRLLRLSVYPGIVDVVAQLVEGERGEGGRLVTPNVMLVEPDRVMKVELLYEPPEGGRDVGFRAPAEDVG